MEEIQKVKEDEIDLMALFQTAWKGRKTIFKFLFVFGLLGLFIAIFSPKEYTATTVMVPTSSEKGKIGGNIGGLAAMAGINLGNSSGDMGIPPSLYPKVVQSVPFKKAMTATFLEVSESVEKLTFEEYYSEVYNPGLLAWLKKYTIGLPAVLIKAIRGGEARQNKENKTVDNHGDIVFVSAEEQALYKIVGGALSLQVNDKEGYVTLSASMPEALAAAQMAERAQKLLQHYIIDFKSKKAKEQLKFIEERYAEKGKEFRKAELALASFQDRNRNVATATAMTEQKRLQAEYSLIYNVYTELAKQLETQKIQVKEDTPVFTIIEPVSVPVQKSKPKRAMILIIWLFLGGVLGMGVVFGREWLKSMKNKK